MTEIGELAEEVELNPEAPQPPFPLYLDLPRTWTFLDTNPATWERSAQNMLDTTFHRSKLSARERREVMGFFDQLVADCQQAGAALSLIQVGRLSEGGAASLGIHLAFGDEGQPASLASVRDSLPRTGTVTEVDSGVGPALLHSERMTMVPPGATELAALTSIQIFVPIPGTTWTAVFATASAYPELTDPVEQLLRAIVASFRRDLDPAAIADPAADADAAESTDPAAFTALPKTKGPGIERGFTTLIRKRIEPAGGATPDDTNGKVSGG
jgi:hypothetical protein